MEADSLSEHVLLNGSVLYVFELSSVFDISFSIPSMLSPRYHIPVEGTGIWHADSGSITDQLPLTALLALDPLLLRASFCTSLDLSLTKSLI